MKFSICTPVVFTKDDEDNKRQPRYELFIRCMNSVLTQTFEDFEWVIVDDKCQPMVEELIPKDKRIKVIRLVEKGGRLVARNLAMENASGEWITWLDGDDEYSSVYLEAMNKASLIYPDYKMFNMNHLIFGYDYTVNIRKFINMDDIGEHPFGSGTVGAGSFIFKRELFEQIGKIPELGLWQLSEWAMDYYPEVQPFFWNEQKQAYNSLGNPWGEDWLYFYMLTRKNKCKYLDTALYFVHSHYGHRFKEDPDYSFGEEAGPIWRTNVR